MATGAKAEKSAWCDRCEKAPATAKLTVAGLTVNGRELVNGAVKQRLCEKCACKTLLEFSASISGAL